MIDRFLTIGAVGFAEVLCAVAGPASALAQQTQDTVFYQNGAEQVALAIHLDSMGIQAAPRATEQMITAYFDKLGLTVRRLGPGTYALGLLQPARDKQDLFDRGRDFYLNRPDLFENAGPLARFLGADEAIVLTDQFIVMYHANAPVEVVDSMVTAWRVELLITAPTEPELRLYRVTPNSPGGLMEATAAFQNSPLTKWAYPDFLDGADPAGSDPAEPLPVDPLVANQWHLENSSGADIGATQAWAITTGEPGVVIAVLDNGGFDVDHPDLRPNLWRNEVEITGDSGGMDMDDDDGNGYDDDYHGYNFRPCVNSTSCATAIIPANNNLESSPQKHGTAVAGLAAADGDNGVGVSGVCPDCSLMLITTGGQWGKQLAFRYAQSNGANVINASWTMYLNTALENIIRDVANGSNGYPGIPIVFAIGSGSGNGCGSNGTSYYVVSMDEVFAVGSSNNQDQRVFSSNTGPCLDLLAPGGHGSSDLGITTTDHRGVDSYNPGAGCPRGELTTTEDYTNCFGGTSAAAPIVSGVIGLMLTANPTLTTTQISDILELTAEKIDCAAAQYGGSMTCPSNPNTRSDTHGYGRVDALAAVEKALQMFEDLVSRDGGVEAPSVELGARAGWTRLTGASGGQETEITNAPGGGPTGEPVFHLAWFTGPSAPPARWMWEVQLGSTFISLSNPTSDTSNTVGAIQASYLFNATGPSFYLGPNFAFQHIDSGNAPGATNTFYALGGAVGFRFLPTSHLALRVEGRFRSWTGGGPNEVGMSVGFGVLIP